MAHTPGPWHTDSEKDDFAPDGRTWIVLGLLDEVIVQNILWDERDNARLIAAAPELLAALKAHMPWHTEPTQGWGVWQDAVDAINKAEGRGE